MLSKQCCSFRGDNESLAVGKVVIGFLCCVSASFLLAPVWLSIVDDESNPNDSGDGHFVMVLFLCNPFSACSIGLLMGAVLYPLVYVFAHKIQGRVVNILEHAWYQSPGNYLVELRLCLQFQITLQGSEVTCQLQDYQSGHVMASSADTALFLVKNYDNELSPNKEVALLLFPGYPSSAKRASMIQKQCKVSIVLILILLLGSLFFGLFPTNDDHSFSSRILLSMLFYAVGGLLLITPLTESNIVVISEEFLDEEIGSNFSGCEGGEEAAHQSLLEMTACLH